MEECKPSKTPIDAKLYDENTEGTCIVDEKPYRQLIGYLMYLMLTTRPDLSVAVNYYSRYQSNATEEQWRGLKRILRYIKGTLDYGLFYERSSKKEVLVSYADANWATDRDRKSTSGYIIEVYGAVVHWTTRKQTSVALSSTEAEYVALATAATELIWLKELLDDMGVKIEIPVVMFEDNQSVIYLLDKWEHKRLKHVDVKYNFVRDLCMNGIVDVKYVPTDNQKE